MRSNGDPADLPDHWEVREISDIAELVSGQHIKKGKWNESDRGLPYLTGPADFGNKNPSVSRWTEHPKAIAERGDVLVTVKGAGVGKTNVLDLDRVSISRQLMAVNSNGVEPEYIFYLFKANFREFQRMGAGSTVPGINREQILSFEVPLPPQEEQKKIVEKIEELFSKLDTGMNDLETVETQLKRYRQSILKSAVEGKLTAEWRHRNSESLGSPDLEEKNLIETPSGWVSVKFEDVLAEKLRNGKSAKKSPDGNGIRTLTLSAVTERDFSARNTKITVADPEEVESLWLQPGDIFIERSNTKEYVGMAALYQGEEDYAVFPDLLVRARVDEEYLIPEFANYFLMTHFSRNYFRSEARSTSGSMAKINQKHIRDLPFIVPPRQEQELIVKKLDQKLSLIDQCIELTIMENERSNRLRQSILTRAFNGGFV